MTDPARVGELLPGVLGEVVDRAGHGYDRWMQLVGQAGYCHHPIRLAGRVEQADRQTGEVRQVYTTEGEPDGVLLKACGTRREPRCPSCAPPTGPTPTSSSPPASRAARASLSPWQGTPAVGDLHAPSFGRVHTNKAQGRLVLPRHPYRQGARCSHGNRAGSWHRHK